MINFMRDLRDIPLSMKMKGPDLRSSIIISLCKTLNMMLLHYRMIFLTELFKTMDKRNTKPPPPLNTSSVAETRFHSSSDSNNGHIHSHIATSTENGPSNSPHSFYELPSFEEASNRTSSIDVALLKPLGLEKFTSNDSVYDKLSEPSNSSEDIM